MQKLQYKEQTPGKIRTICIGGKPTKTTDSKGNTISVRVGAKIVHRVIGNISPSSRGVFIKSKEERKLLKSAKRKHKSDLVNAGFDPRTTMNLP